MVLGVSGSPQEHGPGGRRRVPVEDGEPAVSQQRLGSARPPTVAA